MRAAPSTALVLGAGGIGAWAFHFGVLDALAADGVTPHEVERFVGTSAGAVMSLALAAGTPTDELRARLLRRPDASDRDRTDLAPRAEPERRGPRRLLPPRPALALEALRGRPGLAWAGIAPEGLADSRWWSPPGVLPSDWPERAWVATADIDAGELALFGPDPDRRPDPVLAVAASMAVPGLATPVVIDGRRHVDGAVLSSTHADQLITTGVERVVVSAPMARPGRRAGRILARRALATEIGRLGEAGIDVVSIVPDDEAAPWFDGFPVRRPEAGVEIIAAGRRLGRAALGLPPSI